MVDDEPALRKALGRLLRLNDCEVIAFASGDEFLQRWESDRIDCVLLDLHLPGKTDGFRVLDALRFRRNHPAVVVMTGHDQPGYEQQVRRLGAAAYLHKPIDEVSLMAAIWVAVGEGE